MKKRWSNPDYLKIQREYKHTPEAIAKITAASKGRKFSEHTRQKMRDNAKKRPSSYYTKAVAASHTPEATAKRVSKLRGQKRTLEQRERMRQARLNYLKWTKENGEDSSKDSA